MSLADKLVDAAEEALGDVYRPEAFGFEHEARAAVIAVLRELVDRSFPEDYEDVDYHYACEGLAMDACDALRELEANG